jgi:hypothetical protein
MRYTKELSREVKNRISYVNFIIMKFARYFKLPASEAFKYLDEYGGMAFLYSNYEYEHTQADINTCMALLQVCRNNGGSL